MKKLITFLLSLFLFISTAYADDLYPAANAGYVKKAFLESDCLLMNTTPDGTAVNMEYLLKTVDICNNGVTSYGSTESATTQWANTNAVDWCAENLIIEDKHIMFTGAEYINTGIDTAGELKVEFDFKTTGFPSAYPNPWGGRTTGYNGVELQYAGNSDLHFQVMSPGKNLTVSLGRPDTSRHVVVYDYGDSYIDGQFKGKAVNYDGVVSPYSIFIGAMNENGQKNSVTGWAGKVYSMKIWKSGILMRDFIPFNNNGEWGLWDNVSNSFFGNSGPGTITGREGSI